MFAIDDNVQVMCNFYEYAKVIAVNGDKITVSDGWDAITWNANLLQKVTFSD